MHAPAEAMLLGMCEQQVFQRVIEVLAGLARLAFAKRRFCLAAAVILERAEVMLGAGDQRHVLQRRIAQRFAQMPHHRAVGFDVLALGVAPCPGAEEHVGDRQATQRGAGAVGIQQIGRKRDYAVLRQRAPCQAIDGPAIGHQDIGEVVTGNAGHADNQCSAFTHGGSSSETVANIARQS